MCIRDSNYFILLKYKNNGSLTVNYSYTVKDVTDLYYFFQSFCKRRTCNRLNSTIYHILSTTERVTVNLLNGFHHASSQITNNILMLLLNLQNGGNFNVVS